MSRPTVCGFQSPASQHIEEGDKAKNKYIHLLLMSLAPGIAFADAIEGKRGPGEIVAAATENDWREISPSQILVMELARGDIVIELSDTFAKAHVAQMKTLAKAGFYDGLSFYRVIDGFVAQGGDVSEQKPLPDGASSALTAAFDEPLKQLPDRTYAFSDSDDQPVTSADSYADLVGVLDGFPVGFDMSVKPMKGWLLHCAGAVAFGRTNERDSASTEFYITLQPQRYLDRNLTVFGRVISGMEHVQAIKRQPPPQTETDPTGEEILRVWMADAPPADVEAPRFRTLRTDTPLFEEYVASRRNRPEEFFYFRPDHVDICQLPIQTEKIEAQVAE